MIALLWSGAGRAQEAADLLKKGKTQFYSGWFAKAIRSFQKALSKSHKSAKKLRAKIYRELGQVHAAQGDYKAVRRAFKDMLKNDASLAIDKKRVKRQTYLTFVKVKKKIMGHLDVTSDTKGARVYVDGRLKGPAPYFGSLPVGWHSILVRTTDGRFDEKKKRVLISFNTRKRVRLNLNRLMGQIAVNSLPPGAFIHLDDKRVGTAPLKRSMPTGKYKLKLALKGHKEFEKTIQILPGKELSETIRLSPLPKPRKISTPIITKKHLPVMEPRKKKELYPPLFSRKRTWTWVTLGVGTATLLTGIGFGIAVRVDEGKLNSPDTLQVDIPGIQSRIKRNARAANGLLIAGGITLVGSVVLFFLEGRKKRISKQPRVNLNLVPGGMNVSMGLDF